MDASALIPISVIRYFFIAVGLISFAAFAQIMKIVIEAFMQWWLGKKRKETGENYRRKNEQDIHHLTRIIEGFSEILKQVSETQIRTSVILERQETMLERIVERQGKIDVKVSRIHEKVNDE